MMSFVNQGWVILAKRRQLLVLAIFALGFFFRVYQFPNNPPGLYTDEAYVGYEAFSILHTGGDGWGVRLPVYFISGGSGQSVLYSYLSIPIIAAFGLDHTTIRFVSLLIGILTLPLLYVAVKRVIGERAAILSTLLLAIMPWHVMISRWALDANLLPFFILLGVYTTARGLVGESRAWSWLSLIPWALSLYAYAMSFVVIPILGLLFFLLNHRAIFAVRRSWLVAFLLFFVLALPMGVFILENFVFHAEIGLAWLVPLSIPILPYNRWAQVSSPILTRLVMNFFFLISGFQDGEIRNNILGIAPIFFILIPAAMVGAYWAIVDYRNSKRLNTFVLWFFACVPLFFITDLQIHRLNAIFVPMTVVGVAGLLGLSDRLRTLKLSRRVLLAGASTIVALQALIFAHDYFLVYSTIPEVEIAFFKGFDRALYKGISIVGPSDAILVTDQIAQPHMLTAMYVNYPPDEYQREVGPRLNPEWIYNTSLGRFYFGQDNLPDQSAPFAFVLGKWDPDPCDNPRMALETRLWKVGKCH